MTADASKAERAGAAKALRAMRDWAKAKAREHVNDANLVVWNAYRECAHEAERRADEMERA